MSLQFPEKLKPLFQPARYKVLYGGRGAAKSWGIARAALLLGCQKPIRVLCAREIQKSIADSVHKLLCDQIRAMELTDFYAITENAIRGINGTEFFFAGLRQQTVENLKSFEGVDICWVEEANAVTRKSWMILTPTIRKPDSEIWISFNPELDTDETYQRFVLAPPPGSIVIPMNWRDNPWFPDVLAKEREHMEKTDPVSYRNIWEGEPRASVDGAIYANEMLAMSNDGRIRPCPYDPMLLVHTVWDLGWNDKMSIGLVQRTSAEVRVINYIEDSHLTLADYADRLSKLDYRWGTDFIPHDGAAKDFKTGQSAQEILMQLGRKPTVLKKADIEQGIKATRLMFPRLYVDSDKCSRLIDCLKRYRRMIPSSTNEPSGPLHDEYSHGADMIRYLAQSVEMMGNETRWKPLAYPKRAYV